MIGFGDRKNVVELNHLLPAKLRDLPYDDIKENPSIGEFFQLANLLLISEEAMMAHVQSFDFTGASQEKPAKLSLPTFDLDYLGLRDENGKLELSRLKELFSIVIAYWEGEIKLATQTGLISEMWRRGMKADDILFQIQISTGPDGKLVKAAGRGHEIMQTVIDTYLETKGLPQNHPIKQPEMESLFRLWMGATRSAPIGSRDAANSVLHWSEYRQLGLVDEAGYAQLDQVRLVAQKVFSQSKPLTFGQMSAWVQQLPQLPGSVPTKNAKAAKALLKKKRKQGRVNRRRGRR